MVKATGIESEMELPFAALHQLCGSMFDRLDALPDPQRVAASTAFGLTAGAVPDRLLIGLAILNVLAAASEDAPLLCVVDDAQWLDRESAQTLAFVARRLLADRVGLLFAMREPNSDLAGFPALVVEGLNEADAQTLLSRVLPIPLDDRVRNRLVAETHGNPLALLEWPRGLTQAELADGLGAPLLPMSGQIEERFRRRLVELPEATQRFLTVAAAEPTGDPVTVWRAATILGVSPQDASPAIEAGLFEVGARMLFRHPLVRSAAYEAAGVTERQAAHRALAEATDPDAEPDRRTWHRALGSPGPDEEVAEELEHSASRCDVRGLVLPRQRRCSNDPANLTLDPSRRSERLLAAADAHLEAGAYDRAAGLLAAAAGGSLDDMGRVQLDLLRARHAAWGGDIRAAPSALLRGGTASRVARPGLGPARVPPSDSRGGHGG